MSEPFAEIGDYLKRDHQLFIDGGWQAASAGGRLEARNPATGRVIGTTAEATADDVDRAVAAARASFDDRRWRGLDAEARGVILWRIAELMEANARELALLEVANNGMPMVFADWLIKLTVSQLRYYAGITNKITGINASPSMSSNATRIHAYTSVEPVGVAGLIIPWNGPIGALMIKLAPALAAGCSVVVKPSELTPISALRIAELAAEAGLPAGVMNVVPGYGATAGDRLVNHPDVDKISFTGSTATGKRIVAAAAATLKRVSLELGGKSPAIIFDDADPTIAVPGASMGIFANTGQVCFAGSRLFVQKKSFDSIVSGIADFARTLKVGPGIDADNQIGPLISEGQRERVARYLDLGVKEGAEVVAGGNSLDRDGYFVEPTVFANVNRDMRIVREEIFGPVLVATPVDDLDEIVALANDTRYGLGAGIYTQDVNKAHLVAERLQAGNVWINGYGTMHPAMPFGGYKESGWGRELGQDGLSAFQETKSVFLHLH